MAVDRWLGAIGIVLTLAFGLGAIFFAPKLRSRSKRMSQKVSSNSAAIQAGRDVKLGDDK